MKRFRKKPDNIKQIFRIYQWILVAIMLLLSAALIAGAQKSILNFSALHAQKNCEVLETSIRQAASQYESALLLLRYDNDVRQVMQASSYSQLSPELIDDFHHTLSTKTDISFLADVALTSDLIGVSNLYLPSDLTRMDDAMPTSRNMVSLGIARSQNTLNDKDYLCFGYNYYAYGQQVGNIYLSLDLRRLISALPISRQEGLYFALADSKGEIACLLAPEASGEAPDKIQELLQNAEKSSGFQKVFPRYMIHSVELDGIDGTIYGIIDTWAVNSSLHSMFFFTLSMLLILIAVSMLGNAFFRKNIVTPLNSFSSYISSLRKRPGALQQVIPALTINGCNEIQTIEKEFSALLESLRDLTEQIRQKTENLHQAELLTKNMEIKHLRSQINPHFLYNTLELIRADAIAGKTDQVSSITASLGKFYRYSIKGSPMVTLCEELDYVRAYLHIQEQRYEGRISTIYNISGEANFVTIPKMILQPLVENAIIHGLEPSARESWTLFIGAAVNDGFLTLSVRDNGIGIDPFYLEKLREQLMAPQTVPDKIGLVNVSARLRLQYGHSLQFTIYSAPDDGTCITLQIPIDPENEKKKK